MIGVGWFEVLSVGSDLDDVKLCESVMMKEGSVPWWVGGLGYIQDRWPGGVLLFAAMEVAGIEGVETCERATTSWPI